MKFPHEIFSKGQPKNVHCEGGRQLSVVGKSWRGECTVRGEVKIWWGGGEAA